MFPIYLQQCTRSRNDLVMIDIDDRKCMLHIAALIVTTVSRNVVIVRYFVLQFASYPEYIQPCANGSLIQATATNKKVGFLTQN